MSDRQNSKFYFSNKLTCMNHCFVVNIQVHIKGKIIKVKQLISNSNEAFNSFAPNRFAFWEHLKKKKIMTEA